MRIRLDREGIPVINCKDTPYETGKANCLRDDDDNAIIACGAMAYESLVSAEELARKGIGAVVISLHPIKPKKCDAIAEEAKACGAIITVDENQLIGGIADQRQQFRGCTLRT